MRSPLALAAFLLAGCAEPAVLRAPPITADMAFPPGGFPVPPIATPTGDPPITLAPREAGGAIPSAAPRSGPAAPP